MIALCGLGRFRRGVHRGAVPGLAVDGLRLVAVERGRVIAAGKLGKIKTTLQMLALIAVMLNNAPFGAFPMDQILIYAAVIMTLWSGADYFVRNGSVLMSDGGAA
jgi:CDP-diacylglycerol--glycerol-3-phosphate 3-phosphatidyltransferase